jgi:hypothetical protein
LNRRDSENGEDPGNNDPVPIPRTRDGTIVYKTRRERKEKSITALKHLREKEDV